MSTLVCEPIGESAPSVCLSENPPRLMNLCEIVQTFKVDQLFGAVRRLGRMTSLIKAKDQEIDRSPIVAKIRAELNNVQTLCGEIGLRMSALRARQLSDVVDALSTFSAETAAESAEQLDSQISISVENELSLYQFFSLSAERSRYYTEDDVTNAFGKHVGQNFPSTTYDVIEACKCCALKRDTACVFHLMRTLEIGLAAFANRFGVPSGHTNWHNIIEGIEKEVRNMASDPNRPADWKDQQEFFSQAASHFMFVKDAWRNYTAHGRGKYTGEEAETILINVRAFMQKLSTRLHE